MGKGDCKKCTAFWGVLGLLTLVLLVMLLISASTDKTEQSFPSAVRLEAGGVYVKLEDNLKPKSVENEKGKKQSELMEVWTRDNEVAKDKRFKLGSEEMVNFGPDKGFFSTVQAAWNNHWVLKTRPEDWWTSISQTIAIKIDKHAKNPLVKQFFVSHEGKKQLTVQIGSVHDINNEEFFQAMISQITKNINKPDYTTTMASDFSQSSPVDRIVNSIMLMFSFKEYFEYKTELGCGIPGVIMLGSEEDWKSLIDKLEQVEDLLKPIDQVLQMAKWFASSKAILKNLLETFRGNPDKDWWGRIMTVEYFGSGLHTMLTGWFVQDFLGFHDEYFEQSGLNVVPITLMDGLTMEKEEAALVAGVTGFTITEGEVTDGNVAFPTVQSVLGWGLLMDPNSKLV